MRFFEKVTDLNDGADVLRRRAFGMIVFDNERLEAIHLRPWPKLASIPEVLWGQLWHHRKAGGNRCWLYYNQPASCPNFLALQYAVSSRETTLGTIRGSLQVLDQIARLKQTDAIVTDVTNQKISNRLLERWGWESHVPSSRRRHYIKRFYGEWPV